MPIALVPAIYFNARQYGAKGDGSTDDTTSIQNAINAASSGGIVFFPAGTYKVSSPININHQGIRLFGTGLGSLISISASFSGANVFNITSNFCAIEKLSIQGTSGTYSSNPSADAIQITGVSSTFINDLYLQAVNGWCINSTSTSVANYNTHFTEVRSYQCKQGIHMLGVTASNYASVHVLTNCYMSQIENGDCYFIEDCQDVQGTNILGETAAGSGNSIHIKGASSGIYFNNVDIGPYPVPSTGSVILIEQSANGVPNQIGFMNGIVEGGLAGVDISNGTNIVMKALNIFNNGTWGARGTGGDSTVYENCIFNANGSAGSSGRYDVQVAAGHTIFTGCYFNTPQGTTTQKVNNVVNAISGTTQFLNCQFFGTGFNSSNIFNGGPNLIRGCAGYNPVGVVTPPTVGASPLTVGPFNIDYTVYIKGGTVSAISVGGNSTGLTVATGGFVTVRVPAGLNLTIAYSAAPTWSWFGD